MGFKYRNVICREFQIFDSCHYNCVACLGKLATDDKDNELLDIEQDIMTLEQVCMIQQLLPQFI
jgi:hypothetical protein